MATSLVLSLDTRRARHDGSYPVIFRLTHNTKTTGIKSGTWVHERDWDDKKRLIRSSFKGTDSIPRLNNMLAKRKATMLDTLNKLEDRGELKYLTLMQVKEKLAPSSSTGTVFGYTENLIVDLVKANRIGTARSYRCVLGIVKGFTPALQYKDVLWAIQRYNKNLKKLATQAGIEENLTSYVARHSFASLADEMEIPITGIRDMLGHQKASTTEIYLSDLRKSKIDEYQGRVFEGLIKEQ